MLLWIREKFGPVLIGLIIGLIGFVFVVSGMFDGGGTGGGAIAGKVNGETITLSEFNRELNRRMDFFKNLGGGQISAAQLKAFRIREGVFTELVNRKLMAQAAVKTGIAPGDEEVRRRVSEIETFHKNGQFDPMTYKQTLASNNLNPAQFEEMMREDLSVQSWSRYFRDRVKVADEEVKHEFQVSNDKRTLKYVLLTVDSGAKGIQISDADVNAYLADEAKANIAKAQFEQAKETFFKGKTFDQVKNEIVHQILATSRIDEIRKLNEGLAQKVAGMMTVSKASDGKINALLKPYGVTVRQTGSITQTTQSIPGIGEARELLSDAFAASSPIDPSAGGKAKVYNSGNWSLVALVSASEKPNFAKLGAEEGALRAQIATRKERELYEARLKSLTADASIKPNAAILSDDV